MLDLTWQVFKSYLDSKPNKLAYVDIDNSYHLQACDGVFKIACRILKSIPENEDQLDFETNYKNIYKNFDISSIESHYEKVQFKLSNSKEMAVDGSVINKVFIAGPSVDDISYLETISLVLEDDGNFNLSNFAGISTLTNGVDLKLVVNAEEILIANFKDNSDMLGVFCDRCYVAQVGSNTIKTAIWKPNNSIALNPATNDKIELVIKDNLTGIIKLNAYATFYHIHGGI